MAQANTRNNIPAGDLDNSLICNIWINQITISRSDGEEEEEEIEVDLRPQNPSSHFNGGFDGHANCLKTGN